jgi:hypothetical protein
MTSRRTTPHAWPQDKLTDCLGKEKQIKIDPKNAQKDHKKTWTFTVTDSQAKRKELIQQEFIIKLH